MEGENETLSRLGMLFAVSVLYYLFLSVDNSYGVFKRNKKFFWME